MLAQDPTPTRHQHSLVIVIQLQPMSMYRQVAYLRNRFYRVAQVSHRYLLKTFRFEFNITAQPTLPSFRCWRKQSQIRFSAMSACRAEHTASGGSGQFGHGHGNGHGHGHGGCDDHGHDADPERGHLPHQRLCHFCVPIHTLHLLLTSRISDCDHFFKCSVVILFSNRGRAEDS